MVLVVSQHLVGTAASPKTESNTVSLILPDEYYAEMTSTWNPGLFWEGEFEISLLNSNDIDPMMTKYIGKWNGKLQNLRYTITRLDKINHPSICTPHYQIIQGVKPDNVNVLDVERYDGHKFIQFKQQIYI